MLRNPGPLANPAKPNILLILVDDMGYGDPQCFNPKSRLKTPAIDRLAREGLMFTGCPCASLHLCRLPLRLAHGPLSGEGSKWRHHQSRKNYASQNCSKETVTTPSMVGKWHLGFDNFKGRDGTAKQTMTGGPVDRGFDEFFGLVGFAGSTAVFLHEK